MGVIITISNSDTIMKGGYFFFKDIISTSGGGMIVDSLFVFISLIIGSTTASLALQL